MFGSADDHAVARSLATEAGRELCRLRSPSLAPAGLKQLGDEASHRLLMGALADVRPGDAVLSEEGADDKARLECERVWIVDPLDGTREFSELDRQDWAVHVALAVDGVPVAGAVALPARGLTLATGGPLPALGAAPIRPRVLVSRTRPTEHARAVADGLGGDLLPMGSAGAKAMAVVLGEAEVYAHSGGQYEWDSAAPVAVAAAAGLHVSRLDGAPLRYNQPNPWLPDVLICRREFAARVIDICRGV